MSVTVRLAVFVVLPVMELLAAVTVPEVVIPPSTLKTPVLPVNVISGWEYIVSSPVLTAKGYSPSNVIPPSTTCPT